MDTEILTRRPALASAPAKFPGIAGVYVSPDDTLRVAANSGVASTDIKIAARILTPDGLVTPSVWHLYPPADRSLGTQDLTVPEGWLVSFAISTTTPNIPYGGCFVRAHLVRGGPTDSFVVTELLEGYIYSGRRQAWPLYVPESPVGLRGRIRSITGTDPAAGVEISETVPTNAMWRLRALRYQLVTSAVAANRGSALVIDDGVSVLAVLDPPGTQAASLGYFYTWAPFGSRAVAIASDQQCMLPRDLLLPAGYRFRTNTSAKDAGDNYGPPQYCVEEWITPW